MMELSGCMCAENSEMGVFNLFDFFLSSLVTIHVISAIESVIAFTPLDI